MPENLQPKDINPFVIAAIYLALMLLLFVFFVILSIMYDNAQYKQEWISDASKTLMDLIKVVVGAVIGVFTPSAVRSIKNRNG